jgi:hypothetical protein
MTTHIAVNIIQQKKIRKGTRIGAWICDFHSARLRKPRSVGSCHCSRSLALHRERCHLAQPPAGLRQ